MLKKFCDVCEKEMPNINSGYEITHVAGKLYACSWTCVLQLQNVPLIASVNSLNITKTYAATNFDVFANGNFVSKRSSAQGAFDVGNYISLAQGAFGGKNYISIVYFDTKKIQRELQNVKILSTHLTFKAEHTYYEKGLTAVIGTVSSQYFDRLDPDFVNADRVLAGGVKRNSINTVELPLEIGLEFKSGHSAGIVFGSESANSEAFYGKFVSVGKDQPILTFTCAKENSSEQEKVDKLVNRSGLFKSTVGKTTNIDIPSVFNL